MIVGRRILERLPVAELSQSELARRVGMSQGAMNNLIAGRSRSSTKLHAIARELGTTPAFLNGETDDPNADAPAPPELSREERTWVEYWRALDEDGREAMVRVCRLLTAERGPRQPLEPSQV